MSDDLLKKPWVVMKAGGSLKWKDDTLGGDTEIRAEDLSIATKDGYEVVGCSEWMRAEPETFQHIVELHNAALKSKGERKMSKEREARKWNLIEQYECPICKATFPKDQKEKAELHMKRCDLLQEMTWFRYAIDSHDLTHCAPTSVLEEFSKHVMKAREVYREWHDNSERYGKASTDAGWYEEDLKETEDE